MTNAALQAIQAIFGLSWKFFTGWHIPGTNFTPAAFFMFFMVMRLSLYTVIVPLFTQSVGSEPLPRSKHD